MPPPPPRAPVEVMVMSGGELSHETVLSFQTFITQQQTPKRSAMKRRGGGAANPRQYAPQKRIRVLTKDVTDDAKRELLEKTDGDVQFYKIKGEVGRAGTGNSRHTEFAVDPIIRGKPLGPPGVGQAVIQAQQAGRTLTHSLTPRPPGTARRGPGSPLNKKSTAAVASGMYKRPSHRAEKVALFVASDLPDIKKAPAAQTGPKMRLLQVMNKHQQLASWAAGIERALLEQMLVMLREAAVFTPIGTVAECVDATQGLVYVKNGETPVLPYLPRASSTFVACGGKRGTHWMPLFLLFAGDDVDSASSNTVGATTIAALNAHLYPSPEHFMAYVLTALDGRGGDLHTSELMILSHALLRMAPAGTPPTRIAEYKAVSLTTWFAGSASEWIDRTTFLAELDAGSPSLAALAAPATAPAPKSPMVE